jgi:ABC-type nickel/cobalt efflux system permease component RcnA
MKWLYAMAALLLGLTLFMTGQGAPTAAAHPLGNFSINRLAILDLQDDGTVELRYVVDQAEIPTFQVLRAVDTDRDGALDEAEEAAYLARVSPRLLQGLTLEVDGDAVVFEMDTAAFELLEGQAGLETSRLVLEARGVLPPSWTQGASAAFRDANYEGQPGWRQVVVRPGDGVDLFESTVAMGDVTAELTSYPEDLLESPPNQGSAVFSSRPGETLGVPAVPAVDGAQPRDTANKALGRFASLVSRKNLTPGFVALAMLLAASWGAMHALGPGHGKTVVAAYLVGERGTGQHALLLGLVVTATHTVSVFALGGVAIFASSVLQADDVYFYLSLASGLLVLLLGGGLLVTRLRSLFGPSNGDHHHHGLHVHGHDHGHEDNDHRQLHEHDHGHSHVPQAPGWRGIVALGISGGIVPCPTALVVMLGAVALDRAVYGMVLVTAFSMGLAGVLTGIGLLLVYGRRLVSGPVSRLGILRSSPVMRLQAVTPVLSAMGILGAGLLLTGQAML